MIGGLILFIVINLVLEIRLFVCFCALLLQSEALGKDRTSFTGSKTDISTLMGLKMIL